MIGMDGFLRSWQQQQEAFWSGMMGQTARPADNGLTSWFDQWNRMAWPSAAQAPQMSPSDLFVAPFKDVFGQAFDVQRFFSVPEAVKFFTGRELGEEQIKQLSDYWVGLLNIPTTKIAVEQFLQGTSILQTMQGANKGNPLVGNPMAEDLEKIQSAWQETLESYKDLLDLFGGYAGRVSKRLLTNLEKADGEVKSLKQLFDQWLSAAEGIHKEVTTTPEYQQVFGAFVNKMCLAITLQRDATDRNLEKMGIPTYSELTDVHARIQRLRKDQRRVKGELSEISETMSEMQDVVSAVTGVTDQLQKQADEMAELRKSLASAREEVANMKAELAKQTAETPALKGVEQSVRQLTDRIAKLEAGTAKPASSARAASATAKPAARKVKAKAPARKPARKADKTNG